MDAVKRLRVRAEGMENIGEPMEVWPEVVLAMLNVIEAADRFADVEYGVVKLYEAIREFEKAVGEK